MAQTIDVGAYGACSGGDAAARIQAAINATPNGGTLIFSCQPGVGGAGLVLQNKRRVTIRATNGGGYRALAAGPHSMESFARVLFKISNCDACLIEGLRLDGAGKPAVMIGIEKSDSLTLRGVTVTNVGAGFDASGRLGDPAAAIGAAGNRWNRYLFNTVDGTGKAPDGNGVRGMWVGNHWPAAMEYHPLFEGNTVRNAGHTGMANHAFNGVWRRNTAVNNGCAGIKVVADLGGTLAIIEDNVLTGNACQGLQLDNVSSPMIVRRNEMVGNASSGIYGGTFLKNIQFLDNRIHQSRGANSAGGIQLHGGENLEFKGNRVTEGAADGIAMQNGTYNLLRFICNQIEGNSRDGVALAGGSAINWSFEDNTVRGNGAWALNVRGALSNAVSARNAYSDNGQATKGFPAGEGTPDCSASPAPPPVPPPPPLPPPSEGARLWGDVNGDATISGVDALLVLRSVVVREESPLDLADVNADAEVNSTDALLILFHAVGLERADSRVGNADR
jgi:hypothetical protein